MTRDEVKVEFTGLAHDHLMASSRIQSVKANTLHHHHPSNSAHQSNGYTPFGCLNSIRDKTNIQQTKAGNPHTQPSKQTNSTAAADSIASKDASALSTIAILRRHPMYDSLVLVKRFRSCLNGYTLEFPTTANVDDDPMDDEKQSNEEEHQMSVSVSPSSSIENHDQKMNDCLKREYDFGCGRTKLVSVYLDGDDPIYQSQANMQRSAEQSRNGDIVYVPINGLLDRLDNYDRHGISIDSRVYAFAMGLKTAERFLTSSSEKEIQEAPPL